ncbi:unnamed protein product [Paramecium octaurelia]|uniref:Uncharacterized protein n=1 Tax=Paramecium octaurelia TaxID=43137 RepID=A0A8S1Y3Q4_PAROT|nr:unnamed protein product [Paramecium octaurelia]
MLMENFHIYDASLINSTEQFENLELPIRKQVIPIENSKIMQAQNNQTNIIFQMIRTFNYSKWMKQSLTKLTNIQGGYYKKTFIEL